MFAIELIREKKQSIQSLISFNKYRVEGIIKIFDEAGINYSFSYQRIVTAGAEYLILITKNYTELYVYDKLVLRGTTKQIEKKLKQILGEIK